MECLCLPILPNSVERGIETGNMKVFVTGGNGFVGSQVVRQLLIGGNEVRTLLRETSDTRRIDGLDHEIHLGDILDIESLERGMKDCEAVVHLAAVSSWPDLRSSSLENVIVEGSRNVFTALQLAGNLRCVNVSSASAINASSNPIVFDENSPFELEGTPLRYAIAKYRAEQIALEYTREGVPIVTVNPVEIYGPDDTDLITACNIRDIMKSSPALACNGGFAIAHVEDVAAGIVKALEKGRSGERYILGGDNLTVEEMVRLTLEIAGMKKPVIKIPNKLLRWTINAIAKVGLPTPVIPEVLDYATRYIFVDSSKAKRELGYESRSAQKVLAPVVDWLRETGHV